MLTAIILMNVKRGSIATVSEQLINRAEISEVYTVSGRYDLVALVRVKENEDLAALVTQDMPEIDGIESTESMIAFKTYSRHDLESIFSVGL